MAMEWILCIDKRFYIKCKYIKAKSSLAVFRQEYRTEEDIDIIYAAFKVSKFLTLSVTFSLNTTATYNLCLQL